MLHRRIWNEIKDSWPAAYWDDWLREPTRRKNRHIIRPEICRTYHIGVKGVSNSQYGSVRIMSIMRMMMMMMMMMMI